VELDPTHAVTGVARGTGSLARHTVGGIVDSASLLTETFSKNMAVLTLDRKYAQRRDQFKIVPGTSTTFAQGVESGMGKLLRGVAEGVIGVVRAPVRGAEKRGVEGFAKGVGKGLLGLVVKPVIGLSDAATDMMVGMKGALDGSSRSTKTTQIRPRRAFYGNDRKLRPYEIVDAISAAIMMRTRLAGENYLTHVDLGGRVAIFGVKRFLLLGDDGNTQLLIRLRNIKFVELRQVPKQTESGGMEWGILIFLKNTKHGNSIEVITTDDRDVALDLCNKLKQGVALTAKRS
jgi:vacuolar protein sorting-associated protein 13A/C